MNYGEGDWILSFVDRPDNNIPFMQLTLILLSKTLMQCCTMLRLVVYNHQLQNHASPRLAIHDFIVDWVPLYPMYTQHSNDSLSKSLECGTGTYRIYQSSQHRQHHSCQLQQLLQRTVGYSNSPHSWQSTHPQTSLPPPCSDAT